MSRPLGLRFVQLGFCGPSALPSAPPAVTPLRRPQEPQGVRGSTFSAVEGLARRKDWDLSATQGRVDDKGGRRRNASCRKAEIPWALMPPSKRCVSAFSLLMSASLLTLACFPTARLQRRLTGTTVADSPALPARSLAPSPTSPKAAGRRRGARCQQAGRQGGGAGSQAACAGQEE